MSVHGFRAFTAQNDNLDREDYDECQNLVGSTVNDGQCSGNCSKSPTRTWSPGLSGAYSFPDFLDLRALNSHYPTSSLRCNLASHLGAQSTDEGIQALAFLPNELWIHAGDSITWTFPTHEIHTVTFLQQSFLTNPQQVRPARPGAGGGCPGTTPDQPVPPSFDGSTCVTSGDDLFVDGATYTVTFPKAGNFKLVCLVHPNMTGAVHVLDTTEKLPHKQAFYDKQARNRQTELLSNGADLEDQSTATGQDSKGERQQGSEMRHGSGNAVTAGIGEIVATGAGSDTVSVMRFLQGSIYVRVGNTVEWTNLVY